MGDHDVVGHFNGKHGRSPCGFRFFRAFFSVMPGLDPGIHVFAAAWKAWMAGSSPAMTNVF
jgi:hypothetical protein